MAGWRGIEVRQADLDDPASIRHAFAGASAAFCITNYWEHLSPERELVQAHAMAEAARDAGIEHMIWSTLEDTRHWVPLDDDRLPTLHGKYKVPHFDAKGEANRWFIDAGVPTTFLLTSFYWDNLIHFGMGPRRGSDGVLGRFVKGAGGTTPPSIFPARRIWPTCSSSSTISTRRSASAATLRSAARSILHCSRSMTGWPRTRADSRSTNRQAGTKRDIGSAPT